MNNLEELKQQWIEAKQAEKQANSKRIDIENQILEILGDNLKDTGSNEVCNGFKVTTGYSKSYDQNALMELYKTGEIPNFPFEKTFKAVASDLKYIEKNFPEQFKKIEACTLTKPKKPSFEVK